MSTARRIPAIAAFFVASVASVASVGVGVGAPATARAVEGGEAHTRIADLLQRWDVVAAEQALAAEEAKGELGVLMRVLKAELRFYQGDYDATLGLIDSLDEIGRASCRERV